MVNRGSLPSGPIQSRVRENTSDYTITRPSMAKGDMGVVSESSSATHTAAVWVHTPSEGLTQSRSGERIDGSLMATMLPSTNVEEDDRLTYGGNTYEVQTVVEYPSAANPVVKTASLVRMHVSED